MKVLVCLLFASWTVIAAAAVRLPALISDNMVLQRDQKVPIWGWAEKGEEVTVSMCGESRSVKTDNNGRWMIYLDTLKVGGPYTMIVKGGE